MDPNYTQTDPYSSEDADQDQALDAGAYAPDPVPEANEGFAKAALREIFLVFLPALILAVVIHLFLAQATVVYGQSMEPNLHDHQRLIIEKVSYRLRQPERAEIVVVDLPGMNEKLIKRVIGLPGDTLSMEMGVVYINGVALDEPYVFNSNRHTRPPQVIPAGQYFVMGDNRGNSNDSRNFGPVTLDQLVGRAWIRYWPLSDFTLY